MILCDDNEACASVGANIQIKTTQEGSLWPGTSVTEGGRQIMKIVPSFLFRVMQKFAEVYSPLMLQALLIC